ncbi:2-dehydropantoate 2-reductase [Pararhodobacter sp. CCB-MM2]|uniref:2-dehydropantoate 2-reductase n=1 Tax=Pararhodobacter sp. CCB-MM2 TaxID=1786003 RepID=UPI000830135A|nr:2-dehydropantoate 2-reductase [Pararhodobacter sp. CCB-MM2]
MRIAIFGAGAIGCYVGGRLAHAGADVVLIGRPRMGDALAQGLHLTDYRGADLHLPPLPFATGPEAVKDATLVLICVKSQDSAQAAAQLSTHLPPAAILVSFQNGIGNAAALSQALGRPVVPGMVGFNVAWMGGGHFHQGTQGDLHIEESPRLNEALFARAGLPLHVHDDMQPVMWGKLMLNLNNAINALSGLPLKDQLGQRDYRRCLAAAQEEYLDLCRVADQPLARLSPLPAAWLPGVLRLPDRLFALLARQMLAIDPKARSSMADDLTLGRKPEIDAINGEVARLAKRLGRSAPVNQRLMALVEEASHSEPRRTWSGRELLQTLQSA